MKPVRLVLADDHPLIRAAIRQLLSSTPEFDLVGEAASGKECLRLVAALCPDILVLDIAMPEMNGEQVAREVQQRFPEVKVIALSGYTDRPFVRALIKAGAKGYVVKSASGRELIHALQAVARGKNYLSPEVTGSVMSSWEDSAANADAPPPALLGRREREVLKFIAEGHRSSDIAGKMGIAVSTVEAHRRNILRKLKLHSAADLTRFALRHGIISL